MFPEARHDDLLIEQLSDETIVYDLRRNRAHSLNRAAAVVWRHCDGHHSISDLAGVVRREIGIDGETSVTVALTALSRAHLIRPETWRSEQAPGPTRREMIRKLGRAAVLVPAVISIVAPTAAYAASDTCTGKKPACTIGKTCPSGKTCVDVGSATCGCV
jgi:hypothetical protein